MARTLPIGMAANITSSGAQPSITVSCQDLQRRLTLLTATGFATARTSAIYTTGGSILRAAVGQAADPNTITLYRITSPGTAAQWTAAGSSVATTAMASAGCCLVQTGATIRLFYVNSASKSLVYRDSTNDGVTWGAETVAQTEPPSVSVCTGIAAATTTDVFAAWYLLPQAASIIYRTTNSGAWSPWSNVGPSSPTWGGIRGLQVDATNATRVFVAGVQMRAQQSGFAGSSTTFNGTTWTPFVAQQPMDTPDNGLTNAYPAIHYSSGEALYYAAFNLQDSGSVSTTAQNRVTIWKSADGLTWTRVQTIGNSLSYEAHVLVISGVTYIFDNQTIYSYPGPPAALDPSLDVLAIYLHEGLDEHTAAGIVLSNDANQYNGQPNLKDNAHLQLSLGYDGQVLLTHDLYVDAILYEATAERQTCTITARGVTKFLDQIATNLSQWSSSTVGTISQALAAMPGVTLAALPGTSQFSQVVPSFTLKVGETHWNALKRLGSIYDFSTLATTPQAIKIIERSSTDPSTWSYTTDLLAIAWQTNSDQPNVIRVVGASTSTTNVFAEVQDRANLLASGAHRYEVIVDRLCDTSAKCLLKAQLALHDDQSHASSGAATVTINPQLELGDVVTITDSRVGLTNQRARINRIITSIDFSSGQWQQQLGLELP